MAAILVAVSAWKRNLRLNPKCWSWATTSERRWRALWDARVRIVQVRQCPDRHPAKGVGRGADSVFVGDNRTIQRPCPVRPLVVVPGRADEDNVLFPHPLVERYGQRRERTIFAWSVPTQGQVPNPELWVLF